MSELASRVLDMEDDIRDAEHLLGAAMQLFGDHVTANGDLNSQIANRIWCCVRVAHERNEAIQTKWGLAVEAIQTGGGNV